MLTVLKTAELSLQTLGTPLLYDPAQRIVKASSVDFVATYQIFVCPMIVMNTVFTCRVGRTLAGCGTH